MANVASVMTSDNQAEVDWTNVRPVYQKLNTDFHVLTEPFGISVSKELNRDLGHLIAAIDVIDRSLDVIQDAGRRLKFSNAVIGFLNGSSGLNSGSFEEFDLEKEFFDRTSNLQEIISRLRIKSDFCKMSQRIFEYTEAKRQAATQTEMIQNLVDEWECTGHLPVLFLREQSTPAFERFFLQACSMMPAIDMIQDARMDYKNGDISVRPTIPLYLRLLAVFLLPLPKLLWRFPARWSLIKYAVSFLRV